MREAQNTEVALPACHGGRRHLGPRITTFKRSAFSSGLAPAWSCRTGRLGTAEHSDWDANHFTPVTQVHARVWEDTQVGLEGFMRGCRINSILASGHRRGRFVYPAGSPGAIQARADSRRQFLAHQASSTREVRAVERKKTEKGLFTGSMFMVRLFRASA